MRLRVVEKHITCCSVTVAGGEQPLNSRQDWLTDSQTRFSYLLSLSPLLHPVFDSMGKPGSGIMEASLSFLGFYSECVEAVAPARNIDLDPKVGKEKAAQKITVEASWDGVSGVKGSSPRGEEEPVFGGRYCLANLQLPNSAIKALQVRVWFKLWKVSRESKGLEGLKTRSQRGAEIMIDSACVR